VPYGCYKSLSELSKVLCYPESFFVLQAGKPHGVVNMKSLHETSMRRHRNQNTEILQYRIVVLLSTHCGPSSGHPVMVFFHAHVVVGVRCPYCHRGEDIAVASKKTASFAFNPARMDHFILTIDMPTTTRCKHSCS